jgi:lysophospholipid acyltransferase (LPLAT)-like uncharacterized protein
VKKILQSDLMAAVVCFIGALYIRLVHWTGRWRIEGEDIPKSLHKAGKPFIHCFWHGRLLMMPYCWRRADLTIVLTSTHQDGRLISRTVKHFNINAVEGSTGKGGAQATRRLIKLLRKGGIVGLTPDGPRGPRMRVSEGTIALARLSGAPIVPSAYSVARGRILGSWDRFVLALPFSRGVYLWSDPIEVPRDADAAMLEAKRIEVENAINALTDRADEMMGQPRVEPAPA